MNQRRNIIYLIGGFVALVSIVISFIILPPIYEMASRSSNLITEKRSLNYLSERTRISDDDIGDLREILDDIENLSIDPRRPVDKVIFLEQIASDNHLVMEVNITGPKEDDVWPYLNLIISIRGDSANVYRFIENIQTADWITTIDQLNVRKITERDVGEGEPVLSERSITADMSLRVYFKE